MDIKRIEANFKIERLFDYICGVEATGATVNMCTFCFRYNLIPAAAAATVAF